LILANFGLAFLGLFVPLLAIRHDEAAPWTSEVQTFVLSLSAAFIAFTLVSAFVALRQYLHGNRGYLLGVSIVALAGPAAVARSYLWYLRNVADGTIGGPVALWAGGILIVIAFVGLAEVAIGLASRVAILRRLESR
jgi:hypothetical protein